MAAYRSDRLLLQMQGCVTVAICGTRDFEAVTVRAVSVISLRRGFLERHTRWVIRVDTNGIVFSSFATRLWLCDRP